MAWLHEDAGYSYLGPDRYGKLTPAELAMLQLGFIVRREQEQEAHDGPGGPGSRRKHSEPKQSLDEKMAEYEQKLNGGGATA